MINSIIESISITLNAEFGDKCYAVGERLFSCLEYLDVGGDLVMGTKRKYEVVDGILHFFVNYDLFVYKVAEPVPFMEEVSSETHVKG